MSLIGRLEDLPVSDILRIVYLSRGTGVLEIRAEDDCHSILFRRGLILNARTAGDPSLRAHLETMFDIAPLASLAASHGIPIGVAVLEMNLMTAEGLSKTVFDRVSGAVASLCAIRSGEFHFRTGEPAAGEIEYDPQALFRHGGIQPERILGKNPMQLRVLGNLKDDLAAGKKRSLASDVPSVEQPLSPPLAPNGSVLVVEEDPQILEAIRSALGRCGAEVIPCTWEGARSTVTALSDQKRFFVSVLDIEPKDSPNVAWPLLDLIKARDGRMPVVVLDRESGFRRRHTALKAGADFYLTRPPHQQNETAAEELALFTEDVALFVARQFADRGGKQKDRVGSALEPADKERMIRGFRLLMQLLNEHSEPNDISQLALTILQLAADHVDRCVLFAVTADEFVTLGRFGLRGNGRGGMRIARGTVDVLDRVVETRQPYRGSVGVAPADQQLLGSFDGKPPSEIVVLPIMNGDEIVGLLYGDNALNRRTIDDTIGLEVFLSQAGSVLQNAMMGQQERAAMALAV